MGSVSNFDLKAKLSHPSDLLNKRKRNKKKASEQSPQLAEKDNEKSEMS